MIKLERVLVPSDFSERAEPALKYAVDLANRFDAEIVGCHVIELPMVIIPLHEEEPVDVVASNAREKLESLLRAAGAKKFRVLIEQGNPTRQLVRIAANEDIDLVVVSTHGRSGLSHMLMGSTAENLVRLTPCPVLVVRDEMHSFVHPAHEDSVDDSA